MSIVVDAIYRDGVLQLDRLVPLQENERVQVTIEHVGVRSTERKSITYGLIGCTGDPEVVRRIAEDPEFGIEESP